MFYFIKCCDLISNHLSLYNSAESCCIIFCSILFTEAFRDISISEPCTVFGNLFDTLTHLGTTVLSLILMIPIFLNCSEPSNATFGASWCKQWEYLREFYNLFDWFESKHALWTNLRDLSVGWFILRQLVIGEYSWSEKCIGSRDS